MSEPITSNLITQPRLRAALDRVRPEMAALDDDDLITITVDPLTAASITRGALPQILPLREYMTRLPDFNMNNLDNLENYILASMQTQTIYQCATMPPEHFQELVAEATRLRELFVLDGAALAKRGLLSGFKLENLRGSIGFRNVAADMMSLAHIFRSCWPAVTGKTSITLEELDRAEILGDQLINDIGVRELAPAAMAAVAKDRLQAFMLYVNAYDQVRRAVTYIRWDAGDADEIAPSIYSGRRKKSGSDNADGTDAVTATTTTTSTTTPTTSVASPFIATSTTKPGIGLPGSDPFTH